MAYDMLQDLKSKDQQKLAQFQMERNGFVDENKYDSKAASFEEIKEQEPALDNFDLEQVNSKPLQGINSSYDSDYETAQGGLATPVDVAKGIESFAKGVVHNMPNATEWEHTELYEAYFKNGTERAEEHRRIANALGIDPRAFEGNRDAYIRAAKSAEEVEKYKQYKEFLNSDGSVNMDKIYKTIPALEKIQKEKGVEAAALALGNINGVKQINEIYDTELGKITGSIQAGWERNNLTNEKNQIYAKAAREVRYLTKDEAEQVREINEKLNKVAGFSYSSTGGVIGAMLGGVAENAEMFIDQLVGTAAGGVVAGGVAMSGVGAIGAGTAYNVTSNLVSTALMANQIMGGQYEELLNKTDANGKAMYTPQQAASLAGAQGISEAILEQWTFSQMGRAIMGKPATVAIKDIITKSALKEESELATKTAIGKVIKDRLKDAIVNKKISTLGLKETSSAFLANVAQGAKAGLASGGAELKEEFLQQASDMVLEDVWQAYLKGDKAEIAGLEDILASSTANAIMAIPTVAGFGLIGFSGNRAFNNKYAQNGMNRVLGLVGMHNTTLAEYENSKMVQAGVENTHRLNIIANTNEAIKKGALKDLQGANQDIAEAILDEKNQEVGAEYTYVDVKALNQMDGGAELVNKIAEANGMTQEEVQKATALGQGMVAVKTSSLQLMQMESADMEKLKGNIASADQGQTNNQIQEGVKRVREAMARVRKYAQSGQVDEDIVNKVVSESFKDTLEQDIAKELFNEHNMSMKAYREALTTKLDDNKIISMLVNAIKENSENPVSDNEARKTAYEALMGNDTNNLFDKLDMGDIPAEELEQHRTEAKAIWDRLTKLDDKAFADKVKNLSRDAIMATADLSPDARAEFLNIVQQLRASTNKDVSRAAEVNAIMYLHMADRLAEYAKDAGKDMSIKEAFNKVVFEVNATTEQKQALAQEEAEIDAVRKQYEGTDQWMKAPNGADTNLTEKQWLQVRTPAFKKWFGDWENDAENASKVVDANGEPLVVYHGSESTFDTFKQNRGKKYDSGYMGTGFYFTDLKEGAEDYARWKSSKANHYGEENVLDVFLNIRKPLIPEEGGGGIQRMQKALGLFVQRDPFDLTPEKSEKITNEAIQQGYDGAIVSVPVITDADGVILSEPENYYVVYNNSNIKSATGNIGTFDASNPNIYYQFIGEEGAKRLDAAQEVTTRLDNLNVAREMEKANKNAKTIKLATGWERGTDGKWRYEIDDSNIKILPDGDAEYFDNQDYIRYNQLELKSLEDEGLTEEEQQEYDKLFDVWGETYQQEYDKRKSGEYKLKDIVKHDELAKAYPELFENLVVRYKYFEGEEERWGGYYSPSENAIVMRKERQGDSDDNIKRILLHEIQHAIQHREGFASGGTGKYARQRIFRDMSMITYDLYNDMDRLNRISEILDVATYVHANRKYLANPESIRKSGWFMANGPAFGLPKNQKARKEYLEELVYKFRDEGRERLIAKGYKYLLHDMSVLDDEELNKKIKSLQGKQKRLFDKVAPYIRAELVTQRLSNLTDDDIYQRIAGEVEARNTETRMNMSMEERLNSLASETEDVARKDQYALNVLADQVRGGKTFYQSASQTNEGTLAAYHNTRAETLKMYLEEGGMPVPSLAIMSKDMPYEEFGDITLVGNRDLIDPANGTDVYNRDAWTITRPKPVYKNPTASALRKITKKLEGMFNGTDIPKYTADSLSSIFNTKREIYSESGMSTIGEFKNSVWLKYYYLTKVLDKQVDIPKESYLTNDIYQSFPLLKKWALENIDRIDEEGFVEEFKEAAKAAMYEDAWESAKKYYGDDVARDEDVVKKIYNITAGEDSYYLSFACIDQAIYSLEKERDNTDGRIDTWQLNDDIRKNFSEEMEGYDKWVSDLIEELLGKPKIKIGNRFEDVTLDNIVKAMLKQAGAGVVGDEFGGPHKTMGAAAQKFTSIADMHEQENVLGSLNEQVEAKKNWEERLSSLAYSMNFRSASSSSIRRSQNILDVIERVSKGGKKATPANVRKALDYINAWDSYDKEDVNSIVELANEISTMARQYFEAKPQRAVGVNEFSGAVVPVGTDENLIKQLQDLGLQVETYEAENSASRQEAVNKIHTEQNTLFQSAWHGSPHVFDKFDLGAIGTGEGAQVHGWGLYFAQDKQTAIGYRKGLSGGVEILYKGKPIQELYDQLQRKKDWDKLAIIEEYMLWQDVDDVLENEEMFKPAAIRWFKKSVMPYLKGDKGSLFEVDVPEENLMLDEQKTFDKQDAGIKEKLLSIIGKLTESQKQIIKNVYVDNEIRFKRTSEEHESLSAELNRVNGMVGAFRWLTEEPKGRFGKMAKEASLENLKEQGYNIEELEQDENKRNELQEEWKNKAKDIEQKMTEEEAKRKADYEQEKQDVASKDLSELLPQMVGWHIYTGLTNIYGSPKDASLVLNKAGIEGISYYSKEDGRCFVVFDDKAINVINRYNQQAKQQANKMKGQISSYGNATEGYGKFVISLFESADESTFLHEISHAYLMELEHLATLAPESRAAKDLAVIKGWASWSKDQYKEYKGTNSEAEFYKLEKDILKAEKDGYITYEDGRTETLEDLKNRWMQERFARGFEEYLRSGEAPSPTLKKPFRRLKQWLTRIYKVVVNEAVVSEGAGARASAEVEAVMARMVASDEMIETMHAMNVLDGTEIDADMSDEDIKAMHERWKEEAKEQAKEKMLSKLLAEYKKNITDKLEAYRDEREKAVTKELQEEPCFAVDFAVGEGIALDVALGMFGYESEEQYKNDKQKYNNATLEEAVKTKVDEEVKEQKKKMPTTEELKNQAMEAMANEKHSELIALEAELLKRRESKYNEAGGKLGTAFEEVDKAITQGDINALKRKIKELRYSQRWKEAELKYLAEMDKALLREDIAEQKEKLSKVKDMFNDFKKNTLLNVDWMRGVRDAAQESRRSVAIAARNDIMNMPLRVARSIASWNRQENTAANNAVKNITRGATLAKQGKMDEAKKAYDEARDNKIEQLYDSEMVRQAAKVERKINQMLRKIRDRKRALKKRKMPALNRYYYEHLLYLFGLQSQDAIPPSELTNFMDFWAELTAGLEVDYNVDPNLVALLDGTEKHQGYTHLTMHQLNDLMTMADLLYTTGINANRLLTMDVDIEQIAQEANDDWMNNVAVTVTNNKIEEIKGAMGGYMSSIMKPEVLLRLTGGKQGAFIKYIYEILRKATENEALACEREAQEIKQIVDNYYTREELKKFGDTIEGVTLSNGEALTKNNILAMALNWGNKTNQARLIVGLDLSTNEAQVREEIETIFASTLTRRDWEFVQAIWNHIGRYGDEVNKVVEKLNGVPMKRVEADSFNIKVAEEDGTYKTIIVGGGYYPIVADPKHNSDADEKAELEAKAGIIGGNMALGSGQGSTKARSESMKVKRMLLLDLGVISKHINQQIHIANMRLACRDAYKVLNNQTVANAIQQTWGNQVYKDLKAWVVDIWSPSIGTGVAEHFIGKLRSNTISAIMSYRVSTALLNLANISPMIGKIGWANTMKAMLHYAGHWNEVRDFVLTDSVWMRNRATNMDRDLSQVQSDLFDPQNPLKRTVDKYSNWLIEQTDMLCSVPLYHHVYMETYNKLIETTDEQQAREQAHEDAHEAVRSIFGSADTVDASRIQRSKNEFDKLLTPFFSFANTMFNAVAEKYYSAKVSGTRSIETRADGSTYTITDRGDLKKKYAEFLQKAFYHYIFMTAIETALRQAVDALTGSGGDDKEPEELIYSFLGNWAENSVNSMAGGFYGFNMMVEVLIRKIKGEYSSGRGGSMGVIGGTASRVEKAIDSASKLLEGKQDWIDFGRNVSKVGTSITGFSDTIVDSAWNTARFIADDFEYDDMDAWREYLMKSVFDRKLKAKK